MDSPRKQAEAQILMALEIARQEWEQDAQAVREYERWQLEKLMAESAAEQISTVAK